MLTGISTTGRRRLLCGATTAALLAAMPIMAGAQEAGVGAVAQDRVAPFTLLGRLIFGAGTEKVAIDTPQAVTVLEQDDIDREQPRVVGDLFANVPGVQTAGASARALGQAFNIRGIGNAEQAGSQNRIIINVDGAEKFFELYRSGSFFGDMELFKRVEVLRGPASSTLYGAGAIGGTVNFETKDAADFLDPDDRGMLRFKGSHDSNGSGHIGTVTMATRLGADADLLFSFSRGRSKDMKDGAGAVIQSTDSNRWSGLVKTNLRFGQNRDQTLTFSLSRTDSDFDRAAVAQTGGAAFMPVFGFSSLRAIDDSAILRYRHAGAGNPWLDLDVTLSHSDISTARDNFTNGAMCAPGTFAVLCPNEAGYRTRALKVQNTFEMSSGAWKNYLTLGTQLSQQVRTAQSSVGAWTFHPGGTERKTAVFAQGEFIWNDRLTLTPGLRLERVRQRPDAAATAAGGAPSSDSAVAAKIAALYDLNDAWGIFGSVAMTERMPTLDEIYSSDGPGGVGRVPNLALRKEKARTVELGATYRTTGLFAADDALTAKATLFHNDLTDLIAANSRAPGIPYFRNIGRARIYGAELEAAYEADRWFGQLAYSRIGSRDRATGRTLADTPAENLALTLGAKLPAQGLRMGWRMQAFGGIVTSSASTTASGFAVHDLFVTWQPQTGVLKGIDVNFGIDNVFDRAYRNNLALDNGVGRNVKISLARSVTW